MTDYLLQVGVSNLCMSLALAMVAWVVQVTGKRPAIAHLLWVLVLVKLVTPPVLTIPLIAVPGASFSSAAIEQPLSGESLSASGLPLTSGAANAGSVDDLGTATVLGVESALVSRSTITASSTKPALALFWLLGSACVLAWSLVRVYRFNRLLGIASEEAPELRSLATECAQRLGLATVPQIYTTSAHISRHRFPVSGGSSSRGDAPMTSSRPADTPICLTNSSIFGFTEVIFSSPLRTATPTGMSSRMCSR